MRGIDSHINRAGQADSNDSQTFRTDTESRMKSLKFLPIESASVSTSSAWAPKMRLLDIVRSLASLMASARVLMTIEPVKITAISDRIVPITQV